MPSTEYVEEVLDRYLNLENEMLKRIEEEDIDYITQDHLIKVHKSNIRLLRELKKELIGE